MVAFFFDIINRIGEWYKKYKEKKKHDEMMARLRRNDVHFNQREYAKQIEAQRKAMIKKRVAEQEELRK